MLSDLSLEPSPPPDVAASVTQVRALVRRLAGLHAATLGPQVHGVPLARLTEIAARGRCRLAPGPAVLLEQGQALRFFLTFDALLSGSGAGGAAFRADATAQWRVLHSGAVLLQLVFDRPDAIVSPHMFARAEHYLDTWNGTPILRRVEQGQTVYAVRLMCAPAQGAGSAQPGARLRDHLRSAARD